MEEAEEAGTRRRWIAVGLISLVTVGAILSFALSRRGVPARALRGTSTEKGHACAPLEEARRAYMASNEALFVASLKVAARAADFTLRTDNYPFGAPERIALQLPATISQTTGGSTKKTGDLLEAAAKACDFP